MATGRIGKRAVDAMRSAGVAGFLWDEDIKGFGMKVTSSGAASYILQYRMGGRESKTRRYTIGGHGSPLRQELKPSGSVCSLRKAPTLPKRRNNDARKPSISPSTTMPTGSHNHVRARDG